MRYTKKQVVAELKAEFKSLSTTEWSECGDVNMEEHGGIRYRKTSDGDIEAVSYYGLSNIHEGIENVQLGEFDLDELIDAIDRIWDYSDVENCGLTIGWLINSLDSYEGIFRR